MKAVQKKMISIVEKLEQTNLLIAIKRGLIELLPVILTGAFALIMYSIPWDPYQHFILYWQNGILNTLFRGTYQATFELLSVYMTISMSYQLVILRGVEGGGSKAARIVVSVAAFFILAGVPGNGLEPLGAKGIFTAIVSVALAVRLFEAVAKRIHLSEASADVLDVRIEQALRFVIPTIVVIAVFVIVNAFLTETFEVDSVYQLMKNAWTGVFANCHNDLLKSLLFVVLSGIFWFLGIHGNDMLDSVVDSVFVPLQYAGSALFSRPFLDTFILMGGCGTSICLLLAILIFAKRKSIRSMGRMAVLPAIFNVNEILVYGLPIIYNPYLIVPFFLTPILCFVTTYISMTAGLVPVPQHSVVWTMPVLFSGYLVTGTIRGSILQFVNIVLGTLLYAPFIRMHEEREVEGSVQDYKRMVKLLKKAQDKGETVCFTEEQTLALTAKALIADLKNSIRKEQLSIYYQPQVDVSGVCVGAEALLRWRHDTIGYIYPPLIMQLAVEGDFLDELEKDIVRRVINDAREFETIPAMAGRKVSFNITGQSIQSESFANFLIRVAKNYKIKKMDICLELTEQAAVQMNDSLIDRFRRLKEAGYTLAVDDFSMGSTSIKYLTGNHFEIIKLDGYLVRDIAENERCYEIISHIMSLSKSLDAKIVAEYVSDRRVQEKLYEVGCTVYQGWLYAKPMSKEDYMRFVCPKKEG